MKVTMKTPSDFFSSETSVRAGLRERLPDKQGLVRRAAQVEEDLDEEGGRPLLIVTISTVRFLNTRALYHS